MEGSTPTLLRRRLGRALRRLREQAGVTGDEAGAALERTGSWISRVEGGRVGLRSADVHQLLAVYGVDDAARAEELAALAKGSRQRGWWSRYAGALPESYLVFIGLESAARVISGYYERYVPGLLQTRAYCRAVVSHSTAAVRAAGSELSQGHLEKLVEVRMERQARLADYPPTHLRVLLDEAVIYRGLGGREAFREQLDRLLDVGEGTNIELGILPFERSDRDTPIEFTIFDFADDPAIVAREIPNGITYEDSEEAIATYSSIFERLSAVALSPQETRDLIKKARDKLN